MQLMVRAMHEDGIEAWRTEDEALAREVAQRDQDVDRLYWMVAKQYNVAHTTGGTANGAKSELHNYRLIAKLLERTGDHAQRIARAYRALAEGRLAPKLIKDMDAARESATAILDKAFTALPTANSDAANEAVD